MSTDLGTVKFFSSGKDLKQIVQEGDTGQNGLSDTMRLLNFK